ncbi:hypothetical protein D9758_009121 [Tetrapyrgos nigripes]|uniref:Uncharacterized protein n=1 Tax=Tetrapyrgos nigripes TaxID=182062 RepID=A0A8H5G8I6_9AGAR|nr:hypothetical protein D9758_009121 [Tetrapyrgos nigripes]
MAGIFRKKKKNDDLPQPPNPAITETSNNAAYESPIYARFASNKPPSPQKVVVSGPMMLSARRESFSKPAASAPHSVSQSARREERDPRAEKTLPALDSSQQRALGAVFSDSTSSPASTRSPSNSRDKPLAPVPSAFSPPSSMQRLPSLSSQPPSSPSAKRALPMDKPLPRPDNTEDILSSRPPQSQLPVSRRISSAGSVTRSAGQEPIERSISRTNNNVPIATTSASASSSAHNEFTTPKSRPSYRRPNPDQTPSTSHDVYTNQNKPVRSVQGKDVYSSANRSPVELPLEDTTLFSGPIRNPSASLQTSFSQQLQPSLTNRSLSQHSDRHPDKDTNMGAVNSALAHSSSKRIKDLPNTMASSPTSVIPVLPPSQLPPPTQFQQLPDWTSPNPNPNPNPNPAQVHHNTSISRTNSPMSRKPLIFAAMMVEQQPESSQLQVSGYMHGHEQRSGPGQMQNVYPSPPPEHASTSYHSKRQTLTGPPTSFNHPDAAALDKQSRRKSLTKPMPALPQQNQTQNSRRPDSMVTAPLQMGYMDPNINVNPHIHQNQNQHQQPHQRNVLHSHYKPTPAPPPQSFQQQQQQLPQAHRNPSLTQGPPSSQNSRSQSQTQPMTQADANMMSMVNGRRMSGVDAGYQSGPNGVPANANPNPNPNPNANHLNTGKPHRVLTKQRLSTSAKQRPVTPTKQRPVTPTKQRPVTPNKQQRPVTPNKPVTPNAGPITPVSQANGNMGNRDRDYVGRSVAIPLEDDPFARVEGVRMLKPISNDGPPLPAKDLEGEALGSKDGLSSSASLRERKPSLRDELSSRDGMPSDAKSSLHEYDPSSSQAVLNDGMNGQVGEDWDTWAKAQTDVEDAKILTHEPVTVSSAPEETPVVALALEPEPAPALVEERRNVTPPPLPSDGVPDTPPTPEDYRNARSRRRGGALEKPPAKIEDVKVREDRPAEPFPLVLLVSDPNLLETLLAYLSFFDWCNLTSLTKKIRSTLLETDSLRENILERFLRTVGYTRWVWSEKEPLALSLTDLHDYMRGVSLPTHEYPRIADLYLQQRNIHPNQRDPDIATSVRQVTSATRAYNRVLLRLRAQAEKEPNTLSSSSRSSPPLPGRTGGDASPRYPGSSRPSSRAPSPTQSSYSHHGHILRGRESHSQMRQAQAPSAQNQPRSFNSPLFRLRRAPLLRVFVPSPDGDWLSDASVLECEAELKRAGLLKLMRLGDVVWDMAVGDEGNIGRLVWDGKYLIDLDYTYSTIGDLPKYVPALAFPPSYFHRVIRTGPSVNNPVTRIDVSPWGNEIAANLQLVQDRVRTETPQVRPPGTSRSQSRTTGGGQIPIPNSNGLFVDSGWFGTIVVETEGTNESLADLQDRCGPGIFPPRVRPSTAGLKTPQAMAKEQDAKSVFRILRERSRPGEIWIRAVSPKEQLT